MPSRGSTTATTAHAFGSSAARWGRRTPTPPRICTRRPGSPSRATPRPSIRPRELPAWLFTIARNKVWDHLRRQKIAVLASASEDEAIAIADAGPTPLQQVESRELAQRLVSAVEALPLEQRGAFVMFAGGGLSLEEIAHASGVGVETAKSRLRYARATLRRVLAGERSPPERSAHV